MTPFAFPNHPEEVKSQPSAWLPWNYPKAVTASALDHDPPVSPGELVPCRFGSAAAPGFDSAAATFGRRDFLPYASLPKLHRAANRPRATNLKLKRRGGGAFRRAHLAAQKMSSSQSLGQNRSDRFLAVKMIVDAAALNAGGSQALLARDPQRGEVGVGVAAD